MMSSKASFTVGQKFAKMEIEVGAYFLIQIVREQAVDPIRFSGECALGTQPERRNPSGRNASSNGSQLLPFSPPLLLQGAAMKGRMAAMEGKMAATGKRCC
ncbi:hypothetical protein Y032_0001g364 [Ancylostoma ceylanicum]|uniref:Uncharacterized protein n=1 Tax=Ancylostoma ceylanicum TaxID=53326 RepID=A0A016W5M6_9BILA|nr:hypothetical protein Y032_0001g364 [Ancylostoma ceylanicum]